MIKTPSGHFLIMSRATGRRPPDIAACRAPHHSHPPRSPAHQPTVDIAALVIAPVIALVIAPVIALVIALVIAPVIALVIALVIVSSCHVRVRVSRGPCACACSNVFRRLARGGRGSGASGVTPLRRPHDQEDVGAFLDYESRNRTPSPRHRRLRAATPLAPSADGGEDGGGGVGGPSQHRQRREEHTESAWAPHVICDPVQATGPCGKEAVRPGAGATIFVNLGKSERLSTAETRKNNDAGIALVCSGRACRPPLRRAPMASTCAESEEIALDSRAPISFDRAAPLRCPV